MFKGLSQAINLSEKKIIVLYAYVLINKMNYSKKKQLFVSFIFCFFFSFSKYLENRGKRHNT